MNRSRNTKRIAILLLAAMLFSIMPVSAWAEETSTSITSNSITWSYDSTSQTLTISGTGAMADYEQATDVPWDDYRLAIKEIVIGDGVTSIGKYAFYGCENLTSITVPEGVTSIGLGAFIGCEKLISIDIPEGVTSIGNSAFLGCKKLSSITIPASVETIGNYAFSGCTGLTSIDIREGVTSIGGYAFSGCTGLTSITIPASVTSIGKYAFSDCTGLTSIMILGSVESIGDYAFNGCIGLTSINIPASVKTIGNYAFDGCTTMSSITFVGDSKLTTIGNFAFEGCEKLTSIIIPEGVTSIGYGAFDGCTGLTSITIPDSVTSIGDRAFASCTGLTSITIPDSVTSIGDQAFASCTGLTSITIPEGVTSIGDYAFYGCTGLTSITIPASVTNIDKDAFAGCTALKNVTVPCNWQGSYKFDPGVTVNREHKDENKDYLCDYGCGAAVGSRPSSGGGFSGKYNYPVTASAAGADITLSDNYATAGETVTITVKPDAGRQVDEVIVTDADGKVIPVTKVDDNQYTFTMPAGRVHIAVTTEAADYDLRIVMQINNKNIVANNQTITNDAAPVIVGDRTLVPVRIVTELLGGTAHWDEATRTVTLTIDGKVLTLVIGEEIPGYGTSATIINNRTYVPIRWIIENLGGHVTWIADTQQIIIEK